MSYMDVLWIKIANSYSKWPPVACTQSVSLCGHPSIELSNRSTEKSAAAFRRDLFKLSILGYLFLQHPLPWTEVELPAGLSPSTQGKDNQAVVGFTTLFNILGHQRRFRHRAWKVWQILLRGSNFYLRFLLRAVNLRNGTDGFTSLSKEVILRIFILWKNPRTSETQQWQETNVTDIIPTSDWSSANPDQNPFDYKLCSKLQEMACEKIHPKFESLKWYLRKAAADFST